ncbi:MAG: tetratricopeptide repeat protein, partial [Saprospiraceae bacterium]|nr:tetratricopeptide repeat protein [Saprospiraceae bacterium]
AGLSIQAHGEQDESAKISTQLGHIQYELDRHPQALDWYRQALGLREKLGDPSRLADALSDYGNALDELDNKDSTGTSLLYYTRALEIRQKLDDQPGVASVYTNLGDAHKHLGHYSAALEYLKKAEDICLSLGDEQALMEVYNTMGDVHYRAGRQDIALSYINKYYNIAQDSKDEKYIQGAYKDYAEVYAALGDYPTAYEWRVKYDEYRYRRLNEKLSAEYARKEALFADQKKQEQIEDQKRELRVQEAELASARTRQFALLGGAAALLILAALLFNRNRIRARANRELATKNVAIQQERERADKLLRNILPEKTAEELKKYNSVQPVRYESVTVMFTDFRGFTKIAEVLPPEELISELDNCFRLFDTIIEKYGLEKIKTIGDAYMCAGGLPTSNQTHPVDTVSAALEMLHELHTMMMQKAAEGKPVFEMRVGIHTGPVVAGVVGSHKFAYDIWGDTVNTAARLEQGGEPGKINISETTYQLVRQVFRCTFRGNLGAKNKGEIAMYFVDGRR